jgi:hypothetical protein
MPLDDPPRALEKPERRRGVCVYSAVDEQCAGRERDARVRVGGAAAGHWCCLLGVASLPRCPGIVLAFYAVSLSIGSELHKHWCAILAPLAAGAQLEVNPRMTESSDTSDTPAKPQDYAGLRTELAAR